jgi:cell division transport system permease protein
MFTSAKQNLNAVLTLGVFLLIAGALVLALGFITEANKLQSSQLPFTVILNDSVGDTAAHTLSSRILTFDFVKEVKYISKAEALKEYARQSGEKPLQVLDSNPLFASLTVYTHHEKPAEAAGNAAILKSLPGVDDVYFSGNYFSIINDTDLWLKRMLWILVGVMALLTIIILTTTTRLNLYADRTLVRTALLVGARPGFVSGLFVRRAFRNGLATGLVVALVLYGGMLGALYRRPDWNHLHNRTNSLYILAAVVAMGVILPVCSTLIEIRRILRARIDQMF